MLFAFAITGLSFITYNYLVAWEIGYSSDTALIGLMGKYILERGERPIYVWAVGYQGLILEAYTMAGFFSIFGVNPISINFSSTMYLWLALGVWACVFSRAFGARVAALTMVATVFSVPIFYELNLRSLPNFPEALLLGGLLFLLFDHVRTKYEAKAPIEAWRIILLGIVSGFAFYTFAITVYFLLAISAALAVMYYRKPLGATPKTWFTSWCMPWAESQQQPNGLKNKLNKPLHRMIQGLSVVGWLMGFSALVICFFVPEPVVFYGRLIKWNALQMLFGAAVLMVLPRAGVEVIDALQLSSLKQRLAKLFTVGWFVGYSPASLFILTGGHSNKQALASGNWPEIKLRLWVYEEFHKALLHFEEFWTWPFSLYFLGCMVGFFWMCWISLKKYVRNSRSLWPPTAVFCFVYVVVFVIFVISKTVVDIVCMRYLILMVPVSALMLSLGTHWLWIHRPKIKWLAIVGYLGMVGLGARSIYNDLSIPRNLPFEAIIHEFETRGITYGYADYWLAYASNFLSNEQIILEPTVSNYSPHYGPLVKAATRIGYVDYTPGKYPPQNGQVEIYKQTYKVLEETEVVPGIILRVLEKL